MRGQRLRRSKHPVRCRHISDASNPVASLRGGEVLLTTGRELSLRNASIEKYRDALIHIGAAELNEEHSKPHRLHDCIWA